MKITPDILAQLGFVPDGLGGYRLDVQGYRFSIFRSHGSWAFESHAATHVEELIAFAYMEGLQHGAAKR
jgi:hypothetical protein